MKHSFLLDENILYFAIFGVNEHDAPDSTSTELIRRIGQNCHRIALNNLLLDRYWYQINKILHTRKRSRALAPAEFIVALLRNSLKWELNLADCPDLPAGVVIPAEDIELVRFALLSETRIVTGDGPLRAAVNNNPSLNLEALTPAEALVFAADS